MHVYSDIINAHAEKVAAENALRQAAGVVSRAKQRLTAAKNHLHTVYRSDLSTEQEKAFVRDMHDLEERFLSTAEAQHTEAQTNFDQAVERCRTLVEQSA